MGGRRRVQCFHHGKRAASRNPRPAGNKNKNARSTQIVISQYTLQCLQARIPLDGCFWNGRAICGFERDGRDAVLFEWRKIRLVVPAEDVFLDGKKIKWFKGDRHFKIPWISAEIAKRMALVRSRDEWLCGYCHHVFFNKHVCRRHMYGEDGIPLKRQDANADTTATTRCDKRKALNEAHALAGEDFEGELLPEPWRRKD